MGHCGLLSLRATVFAIENLDDVVAVGYVDDTYFAGSPDSAIEAHTRFRQLAMYTSDGLRFKQASAIWPHDEPPTDALRQQLQDADLKLLTLEEAEQQAKLSPQWL